MERQLGDDVYYQPLDMYDNPNKTIDFISKGSQYWTLCNDAPALNKQSNVIVDTEFDSTYLNNLDIPRPTEHEFFDEWLLDDPSIRIMMQGCLDDCAEYNVSAHDLSQVLNPLTLRMSTPTAIDYESKRKYFAHLPVVNVKATLKYTTQNMRLPPSTYLHKMFKSPNPSANLRRRDEADATDQIFSDTPAINGGETSAHLFVGKKSKLTDAYKAKDNSSASFLKCFQDRVRFRGCPTGLEGDNAPMYRGWKNNQYMRDIHCPLWQCETQYQHQNYAENRWQTVKRYTNRVMDRSGCPSYIWFLALSYVIFCLNHCVDPNLADGTKSPLMIATFNMTDVSPLLHFVFWEPVYFLLDEKEQSFPGKSKELRGHWAGISEHIGHRMTYKLITDDTGEEVCRSVIRSALDPTMKNLREDPITISKPEDFLDIDEIMSPTDSISPQVKAKTMDELQTGHFQRPNSDDNSGTDQASPPQRTTRKRHERPEKLRDSHPPDPSRRQRYNTRSAHSVDIDDDIDPDPTFDDPTEPTAAQQQHFLRSRDTHISDQPDSFVYFRDNGECVPDPIWKEFEVTLQDENGDPRVDDDGNPIKVIAPPPQDLVSRVFLTKPDERGEVKRARVVELINKFDDELEKDPDRIKFKIAFDDDA